MRFLLPCGTKLQHDNRFYGILWSPGHYGIPSGIRDGKPWAADNQAFTKGFNPGVFFSCLETLKPWRDQCLFVVVPDCVGNAWQTLALWRAWAFDFVERGWPLAFVAQDGQELLDFPDTSTFSTLFIGGTTEWKEGTDALDCIKRGQALGKHIHVGRVNWWRRYALFRQIRGSEEFTCDGTRQRFEGIERTKNDWADYQRRLALPLF